MTSIHPDASFLLSSASYRTIFIAALVVFIVFATAFRPREFPLSRPQIFCIVCFFVLLAVFGARLLHFVLNPFRYKDHTVGALFRYRGGFAYLGAPVAGFFFVAFAARLSRVSFMTLADYLMPFMMLERFVGRMGCFLAGCCRGIESHLPWAFPFKGGVFCHPTQLYELIYAWAIFVSARALYKKAGTVRGLTFFYVILWYGGFRFFNELLRADGLLLWGAVKLPTIVFGFLYLAGAAGLLAVLGRTADRERTESAVRAAVGTMAGRFLAGCLVVLGGVAVIVRRSCGSLF